jgi:ketosteroid isomerase-like protein
MLVVVGTGVEVINELDRVEAVAILAGDADALDEIFADDFIVNNLPLSTVVSRDFVLEWVRGGGFAYRSFVRTPEAVHVIGDTAITMGREVAVSSEGNPFAGEGETVTSRYTHVWIRRDDRWRLVARQASIASASS